MKIGVTSVFVPNPIEAFKFYTEVLGFKEKLYLPEHWVAIVVSPEQPDGTALMLEPNHNAIAKNYQKKGRESWRRNGTKTIPHKFKN